ncbi:MAG: hypothetical protein GTO63_34495, partial [Anaerolineae bacterium]|nr:hypothetical protein [Anaerolineae bacterium]NIN99764.1 hypothetical protein [Anaerolineae bacterium]
MLGKKSIEVLRPFLEGDGPADNGEWAMFCPYHDDNRRSASLNVITGVWHCQGCKQGGSVHYILRDKENWRDPGQIGGSRGGRSSGKPKEEITEAKVEGWAEALLSNREALAKLKAKRGLTTATIKDYQIGWDQDLRVYTIPIRDQHGEICNLRRYDIRVGPESDRRKIWSVEGMGTPTIFPTDQLDHDTILICEGEFDALLSIQNGIPSVTRTGTADHWKSEWSQYFRNKRVFICHDMDEKGQHANAKVAAALRGKTRSTTIVKLPYDVTEKHGLDLSDWFNEGHTKDDFNALIRQSKTERTPAETSRAAPGEVRHITVVDSFDSRLAEVACSMQVTVTGKRTPPYSVPKGVELTCDLEGKSKCKSCSMADTGHLRYEFPPESADILSMIDVSTAAMEKNIKDALEVNTTCPRPTFVATSKRTVEELYVRHSIDRTEGDGEQDFTTRKVISTVSHDVKANQTVDLVGTVRSGP